jgi:predicted Rdx family selenoprotein
MLMRSMALSAAVSMVSIMTDFDTTSDSLTPFPYLRAPRASWTQTELFLTFPSPIIRSITLMPTMENGGRFRVWVTGLTSAQAEKAAAEGGEGDKDGWVLVWDRKVEGGFPEVSRSRISFQRPRVTKLISFHER